MNVQISLVTRLVRPVFGFSNLLNEMERREEYGLETMYGGGQAWLRSSNVLHLSDWAAEQKAARLTGTPLRGFSQAWRNW